MAENILESTKKVLNLPKDYLAFDLDIIMHINSVFSTLHQLGVTPSGPDAFELSLDNPNETWDEFLASEKNINSVKTYVYLRVRMLFDPPATSFAQEAMSKQIQELEWRLNVYVEGAKDNE